MLCERIIDSWHDGVCESCYKKLSFIRTSRCLKCSKSIEDDKLFCTDCSNDNHVYKQGYAMWNYNNASKKIIARLKYGGAWNISEYISKELSYHCRHVIKKWKPDAFVPVPLHASKLRKRGFNQAALIASGLGQKYNIPVADDILTRKHRTFAQKYLGNSERKNNLKEAFRSDSGKISKYGILNSIVLIDDIYTTGSTIDGCAMALNQLGISDIYFICVCIGT